MQSHQTYINFFRPLIRVVGLTVLAGFILRLVLIFNPQTIGSLPFGGLVLTFVRGALTDACVGLLGGFGIFLNYLFISDSKYRRPLNYVLGGLLLVILLYLSFFDKSLTEFNKGLTRVLTYLAFYKAVSFGLRWAFPRIRPVYNKVVFFLTVFVFVTALLVDTVSAYFFWGEFGVRYNFIAVDYLVYTNEVIGNIFESYPMVPLLIGLGIASLLITSFVVLQKRKIVVPQASLGVKLRAAGLYLTACIVALLGAVGLTSLRPSSNQYVNELGDNGLCKFVEAFRSSQLNYDQFYLTMSPQKAKDMMQRLYPAKVEDPLPEERKNIVLIMVESLSADYMAAFGNQDHLTPYLDSLAQHSLFFESLYACGNRTVRGLEAVTLCQPPCPGESKIKQPNNTGLYTVGTILRQKGYRTQFLYGGDSYFDNMRAFFGGNGYEIIDKTTMRPEEITCSTVWGACDEDLFNHALRVFDQNAAQGKPFYAHLMTTSNHRPYIYPEGKIDIPPTARSRSGGVKYTDYAIGRFLKDAEKHAWFKQTVFVIIADHCASSAGSTEVPLERYHIPAMIYAPGFVKPGKVGHLVSQVDMMPTVFGLLHFSYQAPFCGRNALHPNYVPRAFAATYQDMGYLRENVFTLLSPTRRVMQQIVTPTPQHTYTQRPMPQRNKKMVEEAVAHYQTGGRQ